MELNIYKVKEVLRYLVLAFALYVILIGYYWSFKYFFNEEADKRYCGNVWKKVPELQVSKSSSHIDYILIIDFEIIGRREINVTRATYFEKAEGDNICFTFDVTRYEKPETGWDALKEFWAFMVLLCSGIGIIVGIVVGIMWIFDEL